MECTLCKVGVTEKGKVTVTLERDGSIILNKDASAEVCTNCGLLLPFGRNYPTGIGKR